MIVVGTNSWVTLAESNTYFQAKYGAGEWTTLSATNREQLLISAYRWLSNSPLVSGSVSSQKLKDAQCEAAWYIYKWDEGIERRRALKGQGVKSFTASKFSETYDLYKQDIPQFILDILGVNDLGMVSPNFSRSVD